MTLTRRDSRKARGNSENWKKRSALNGDTFGLSIAQLVERIPSKDVISGSNPDADKHHSQGSRLTVQGSKALCIKAARGKGVRLIPEAARRYGNAHGSVAFLRFGAELLWLPVRAGSLFFVTSAIR